MRGQWELGVKEAVVIGYSQDRKSCMDHVKNFTSILFENGVNLLQYYNLL